MNVATITEIVPQEGLTLQQGSTFGPQPKGFSVLTNARLVPGGGQIEQTPYFTGVTFTQATYWDNGGSHTESASATTRMLLNYGTAYSDAPFTVTDSTIRNGSTVLQVIRQTTVPTAENVHTGLLLQINSYGAFGLNLGSVLDVEIHTDGTHFRWRMNGNGYSADIAIDAVNGNTLNLSSFTLFWLAGTGFTVGDKWTWTRTDFSCDPVSTPFIDNLPYWTVRDAIFFCDPTGRLLKLENGGIRSAGYRPIYGVSVAIYENHLIIGGYSTSVPFPAGGQRVSNQAACSDNAIVTNLENFIPTNANEADVFNFIGDANSGNVGNTGNGTWRVTVIRNVLFVYTANQVWASVYQGLPTPFSFSPVAVTRFHTTFYGAISTGVGEYLVLVSGIVFFDGSTFHPVDGKIPDFMLPRPLDGTAQFTVPLWQRFRWGFYDDVRREAYFYYESTSDTLNLPRGFLIYQEATKTWYFRAAYFDANHCLAGCAAGTSLANQVLLGKTLGYAIEDFSGSATLLKDFNAGASFQLPTIETVPWVVQHIQKVTDIASPVTLDASYNTGAGDYNTTGVSIEVNCRERINATKTYDTALVFTTADVNVSRMLSYRKAGRIFQFRIKPIVGTGKAPFGFVFNALDVNFILPTEAKV